MENKIKLLLKVLIEKNTAGKDENLIIEEILNYFSGSYNLDYELIKTPKKGRESLIVKVGNQNSKEKIAFIGHMDTVKEGNRASWSSDPYIYHEKEGLVYGRGTSDMKGGLVSMILLLEDVLINKNNDKEIFFIFTSDEEDQGIGIKSIDELNLLKEVNTIIVPEPTDLKIGLGEKGAFWIEFEIFGKTCHGSMPQNGINSLEISFELFTSIKEYLEQHPEDSLLGKNTVAMTKAKSGIQNNVVPDYAKVSLDIRSTTIPLYKVDQKINKLITEYEEKYIGMKIKKNIVNLRELVNRKVSREEKNRLEKIYNSLNLKSEFTGVNYYTDLSQISDINQKEFYIIGPGYPELAHQPNECISLESIKESINIYKELIK